QLAVFANDSTASPNWLHDKLMQRMPSAEKTISDLIAGSDTIHARVALTDRTAVAQPDLSRECDVFSRYLIDQKPTAYILKQYEAAVIVRGLHRDSELSPFDRRTLRLARRNVFFT
ncbi:unnamed protein product, partial [marine sediment metagenome]